jgi:hypothetical protein
MNQVDRLLRRAQTMGGLEVRGIITRIIHDPLFMSYNLSLTGLAVKAKNAILGHFVDRRQWGLH